MIMLPTTRANSAFFPLYSKNEKEKAARLATIPLTMLEMPAMTREFHINRSILVCMNTIL